jgi:Domain of unknown function (DUF5127)
VDGVVYNWLGAAPGPPAVNQVSLEYTSTKSIFTFDVNSKVNLTVTFLSPVYPDDLARQSQQFSYVSIKAKSSDGAPHSVQVYMDVSGGKLLTFTLPPIIPANRASEWASGDVSQVINWDSGVSGDVTYHKFFRANQQEFAESGEIASWGTWYLSTGTAPGVSLD